MKKILSILTPAERKRMAFLLVPDVLISICDILFLALLLYLVQSYAGAIPAGKRSFLPAFVSGADPLVLMAIFFLLFSVKNLGGFLVFRLQCRQLFRVASRLSRNRLMQYQQGDWSGYVNTDSAVQIRSISYQPMEFCQHVLGGLQQMTTQTVLILLTVAAIAAYNAALFLLLLAILLPPTFIVFYLIRSRMRSAGADARASSEKSLQHLQEALAGYVESNIYDKNKVFLERYMTQQGRFNDAISDHTIMQGIPTRMIEVFALLGIVLLAAINRWTGNTDHMMILNIGVFMAAAYKIIPGMVKILHLSGQMSAYGYTIDGVAGGAGEKDGAGAAEGLEKDGAGAAEGPETGGRNGAARLESAEASDAMVVGRGDRLTSIRFKDVQYSYGDKLVIGNQQMELVAGDFLGIAGASGKGKTTLLNLLLGFLQQDKGTIMLNETETQSWERRRYWKNIAYVKQQPFLIHDTVLRNVTLNGQSYHEESFLHALTVSGLTGVLNQYPEKWEKMISENGKNISGGQKQRIAIARALYKNADLVILDEPFNELDERSEQSLLAYFSQLAAEGKMVILITHNKKSLTHCNKIVSLDETET